MNRPHAPTVRQLPPVRRLIAGALIAGAVAATAPAMASAAPNTESLCTYDAVFHRVTVTDNSGGAKLRLVRTGDVIAVQDGLANITHCGNLSGFATVTNTDKIIINTPGSLDDFSGIVVDQRGGRLAPGFIAENDGTSEIEVLVRLTGPNSPALEIVGTPEAETIRAAGRTSILLGPDNDTDVSMAVQSNLAPASARRIVISGGFGDDFISGRGASPAASPAATDVRMVIDGGPGNDTLIDGLNDRDEVSGGPGNDVMFTTDFRNGDKVFGGTEIDIATLDAADRFDADVEGHTGGVLVGKLKLAPAIVRAKPGKVARTTMSWTHPKAWKALRAIDWRLYHGADSLGMVRVKPRSGDVVARGGLELVAGKVSHQGKTVAAKLALRVPKTLAGRTLRVDVQATDRDGRTQLAPSAGLIRVGR